RRRPSWRGSSARVARASGPRSRQVPQDPGPRYVSNRHSLGRPQPQPSANARPNRPQWSPVAVTGTTRMPRASRTGTAALQWSPVGVTGTTCAFQLDNTSGDYRPQWSPVAVTGTTHEHAAVPRALDGAAMEPGRGDRDDP